MSSNLQDSRAAQRLHRKVQDVLDQGVRMKFVQMVPHLVILSRNFYKDHLKPLLAKWLLLWLNAKGLARSRIDEDEALNYLMRKKMNVDAASTIR